MSRYRKFIVALLGLIAVILTAETSLVSAGLQHTFIIIETAITAALVYIAPNEPPTARG